MIASSGLAPQGWEDVALDSILHIDLRTRSLTFDSFDCSADSFEGSASRFGDSVAAVVAVEEGQ